MQSVVLFSDMPCSLGHTFGHPLEVYNVITDQIQYKCLFHTAFLILFQQRKGFRESCKLIIA